MGSAALVAAVPYQLRQLEFPARDEKVLKTQTNSFWWLSQPQLSVPDLVVCSFHKILQMVLSADESVLKVTKMAMGAEFKAGTVTQQFTQMIQVSFSTLSFIRGGSCHKYQFRCDKYFVPTKICLLRQIFVATNIILSWQKLSWKRTFVETKHVVCRNKSMSAATKLFVVTKLWLSREKFCHDRHTFCRHKRLAATKLILVAAPAKDAVLVVFLCFLLDVSTEQ